MRFLLNFITNTKVKSTFIILILLCIFIFISALSYTNAISSNIADSVFRLHVIANSDSAEDQELKYKVRDALLQYMDSLCSNSNSKSEIVEIAKKNEQSFYNIARKVISENSYDYNIAIKIGNYDFPTKNYGDITLPAGNYEALRVEIGEATGQNWWCVMFPPLCFVDISTGIVPDESKEIIKDNLSDEEYDLISKTDKPTIKFKFSLIEMLQNLKIANK